MKVALIKQALDVFGPWSSAKWDETGAAGLLDVWPSKAVLWEMTCLLKADWYVIPQKRYTDYTQDAVLKYPGRAEMIMRHLGKVVEEARIPFEEYDVVITFDPILRVPKRTATLFCYFAQEHWDRVYIRSVKKPLGNYDLFLAHMMDAAVDLTDLPQAVAFPYLRTLNVVRSFFSVGREEAAWVDWRVLTGLSGAETWNESVEPAAARLAQKIGLPVRYKSFVRENESYGISDPPTWGDMADYLRTMARCKYYIGIGPRISPGQGLCDAASLGCICIGEQNKPFHRIVCHPACLCADMFDMPRKLRRIVLSPDLQQEIQSSQDAALQRHFAQGPLAILEKAVRMKRKLLGIPVAR